MLRQLYYLIKPAIPRRIQIYVRRAIVLRIKRMTSDIWPIDKNAGSPPEGWRGWPDGKKFALVLTHDVDTGRGLDKCANLLEIERSLGFFSSFNFVPLRYQVSSALREDLVSKGFEVGVHGLYHDGKLYKSKELFLERASIINQYLKDWGSVGFRSPSMHHNLDWIHELDIEYDASTFDTDPFEPQPDGMQTIFPFLVNGNHSRPGYVELPYTLPQDFTLFVLLKEKNIKIWQEKLDWIVERGGMALLNTHPDYMSFNKNPLEIEEYPAQLYREFLCYVRDTYRDDYWPVLPKDMAAFWKSNYK
jgi:hypothetical protein